MSGKNSWKKRWIKLEAHGDTARPFATVSYFARASDKRSKGQFSLSGSTTASLMAKTASGAHNKDHLLEIRGAYELVMQAASDEDAKVWLAAFRSDSALCDREGCRCIARELLCKLAEAHELGKAYCSQIQKLAEKVELVHKASIRTASSWLASAQMALVSSTSLC